MTRTILAGGAVAAVLALLAVAAGYRTLRKHALPTAATAPAKAPSGTPVPAESSQGFLYGRIETLDGTVLEGRLRFGGGEEAFWGDYFNGSKHENPWLAHVPAEARPVERSRIEFLGIRIADRERPIEVRRQLMTPFGEIARIEARGREVRVTLKSGTVFVLDRLEAGDFDDGVRVWDAKRGVVDLDSLRIRAIDFLPALPTDAVPERLHGAVRTRQGEFTGYLQWDRQACVGTDELDGHTADGEVRLRFDTIRTIARAPSDGARVTLLDGREIELSGSRGVGPGSRGIHVDDPRYGRVLISWDAFERVDFRPGGSGPAYGEYPPGRPLAGSVTTRAGRRHAGRLVYDLDESETTETLDAPALGVDYAIPFDRIASIAAAGGERGAKRATVTLRSGEELELEPEGDLGERNAGLLIFVDGRERPEYVPWAEVERVDLDGPAAGVR